MHRKCNLRQYRSHKRNTGKVFAKNRQTVKENSVKIPWLQLPLVCLFCTFISEH